ncbi:MAG: GIY-YIG nuclease family protein [Gordonia sp. (in: high G+C Gram-positive bacteria)]|uniref:GIY-YIG nuclease family protein n=1 Tax=Gordonia sp. (in: high G+C Gram-positive bacteria) TaxID=84139 RepID=UPI0039E68F73
MNGGFVYILQCSDGSGSTRSLDHRTSQHLAGLGGDYTRRRQPVELVFAHECASVQEAWGLERKLHGWSRAKKAALIAGRFDLLPGLCRGVGIGRATTPGVRHPRRGSDADDPSTRRLTAFAVSSGIGGRCRSRWMTEDRWGVADSRRLSRANR